MDDKFDEFITVLLIAVAIGMGIWASLVYLEDTAQVVALFILVGAVIVAWQILRRRFGRHR